MGDANADVLVVDDDEGHAELIRRNLKRSGITNNLVPRIAEKLASIGVVYGIAFVGR